MYVRDAKNREEAWLLEHIETMGLDDTAFRSRDYVVAVDETSGETAGFGRIRVHKPEGDENSCELTSIGVPAGWRGQGIGAHVVERLVEYAGDQGFDTVYSLTSEGGYLAQFGFRRIEEDALPGPLQDRLEAKRETIDPGASSYAIDVDRFRMPDRLREAFKRAPAERETIANEESAEDFGIDPDSATYKYDTGD
ncbi:GNAT family N-acetyltransferase [Natronorubrum daqingense]|uniref:GNAT family N-acetyltransferase n=1 Tax=Natronorubrum daqingense TaxID=588898 RepID=A0A1N7DVF5_9EURY|nr:GNAT family N-acetyltransferase [Natronorubrum daqingense]APX96192.1 GNAT family N-acetyltransferase [Natronorubrum daqingense]SIR79695.1 N-acetylglutamate synthase, GNAT family [Natronorubrum daqingense]